MFVFNGHGKLRQHTNKADLKKKINGKRSRKIERIYTPKRICKLYAAAMRIVQNGKPKEMLSGPDHPVRRK